MDSTKKRSVPLMVVCVLGLLMVPGELVPVLLAYVSLTGIFPFIMVSLVAAISFILLMIDKNSKFCAVVPLLCIPIYLVDIIDFIRYLVDTKDIIHQFHSYDFFDILYFGAVIFTSLFAVACFILSLLGCIKPKFSWMALASSVAAIALNLMSIISAIYVDPTYIAFSQIIRVIFSVNHIFFFFGIAVFLYGRWKRKQGELSV
ncbi:MAG: hypothetical protein IJN11_04485 [Oscillospiraceae bacterium]|nr:hypothetical protein [Oscillospiraceae bacterium]